MFRSLSGKAPLLIALAVVVSSGSTRADEADDQYAVAANLYARQQWKRAAGEFEVFVQQYPQHPKVNQAIFFLGETLTQLDQLEQAASRFREYLQREPQGKYARSAAFRAAEASYFLNQREQAKGEFERFTAHHPDDALNAYALAYLGNIALAQDDLSRAEQLFRQCLTRFPDGQMQDDCRFGLARVLDKQGKSEEAARYYLAVAGKTGSPLAADSRFFLGSLQYAQGKYAEAIETFDAFESALARSPWQATARLGRAWCLLKLDRPAEARKFLELAATDAKVGLEARYWLGLAQKTEKDWRAAAKTLLEAAAADPKHKLAPAMRFHAGDALLRAEDFPAALEQFHQVLAAPAAPPWQEQSLRGRIQVALRTKDYASLDRDAADFVKRFPNSPLKDDVQCLLARSLIERKQFQQAAGILEPLVAGASKGQPRLEPRYLLSLAYEGLERRPEALEAIAPVLESASAELKADALLTQASLLVAMKKYAEAIPPLEALLAGQPANDAAVKGLGQLTICYARTNQLDKSKTRYAEMIEKYAGHELFAATTEQLAEAAYEAGDAAWSARLFEWLSSVGRATDREAKGLSGLGWSQYKAGQLEQAAATFAQVLQKNPGPTLAAEAALIRGHILQQLKQPEAALAMYDLVIDKHPQSRQMADALWAGAKLRGALKQHQQAAALYERLAKEFPTFAEIDAVWYQWAWALADLGRKDESNALFERLLKEHPQSALRADATFRLAQRAFEAKDYAKAQTLTAELLAGGLAPAVRQSGLYLSGQIAIAQERWDDARRTFEAFLQDFPQSTHRPMAEFGVAEAIFRQGDYAEAARRFERLAGQTEPRDASWAALVRLRLAQALCHQKKWKEALAIAGKIEKEYPQFEEQYEADYVVGRCLADQADFDAAREAYRKVIRSPGGAKTETAAKAQLLIAESYYHQKNYEAALREYLRVEILYAFPALQAAAALQAAHCHEKLGEWKEAADLYARLIKTYPDSAQAKEATQLLREAKQREKANQE